MSMHLEKAFVTTTRYRSRNKKSRSKKLSAAQLEHQKWLAKQGLTLTQIKDKLPHDAKGRRKGVYEIPDLSTNSKTMLSNTVESGGYKPEPKRYTGTLIKGISTMHKSNAVPVINDKQAKEIANMRRG